MRQRALLVSSILIGSCLLGLGCGRVRIARETPDQAPRHYRALEPDVQRAVEHAPAPDYVTPDAEGARLWQLVRTFYHSRGFAPAWLEDGQPQPRVAALVRAVHAAEREGLDPELYAAGLLDRRRREAAFARNGLEPGAAAAMDIWLTWVYMKFATDLAGGVYDLAHADPTWQIQPEPFDPLETLQQALRADRIAESLAGLVPDNPEYRALQRALVDHREMAANGGWPQVPAELKLKPGDASVHVGAVARRLAASGDYTGPIPTGSGPSLYGPDLQEAVKRFQQRHGLTDDGIVGPQATTEMNVPIDARIRQIELNMERWRWLPRTLGERYVLVNIPEMRLDVWERGTVPLSMRVVVGKPDTQTPIFNHEMTYLVFAPYWNVPADIAREETIPSMQRDPGFLTRTNMELVDRSGTPVDPGSVDVADLDRYRFRQRPGASNSLGLVKFMFPNEYNVYLHDTPADALFARASRSFSHGCVRLAQPEKLAEYVLRDQPDWTPERIEEAMHGSDERIVRLREPLPVYLVYWTARAAADRGVQFRRDVYGIDARLASTLAERVGRMQASAGAAAALLTPAAAGSARGAM